jgi:septal ring factor EnvC (AmiA/AmiB activator)
MTSAVHLKTIKDLIGRSPLIIDPQRDAVRFQNALAGLSNAKLETFYRGLNSEERRRFHYAANVCLGYDSWSQLYKSLVVAATQERLADRMEEAYAHKTKELSRRESELEDERLNLGEQFMALEAENKALQRENNQLGADLQKIREENSRLLEHQEQMQQMVERYRRLIADLKSLLVKSGAAPSQQNEV